MFYGRCILHSLTLVVPFILVGKPGWVVPDCHYCFPTPPFEPNFFVTLHNRVYALGQPNFLGARFSVPTSLNLSLWRLLLTGYSDAAVCDYLEFGWPIGYDYSGSLPSIDF